MKKLRILFTAVLVLVVSLVFSLDSMAKTEGFVKGLSLMGMVKGEGFLGYGATNYYPNINNKKFSKLFEKYGGHGFVSKFDKNYAYAGFTDGFKNFDKYRMDHQFENVGSDAKVENVFFLVYKLNLKNGKYNQIFKKKIDTFGDALKVMGHDGDLLVMLKEDFSDEGSANIDACNQDGFHLVDSFYAINVKDKKPKLVPYTLPDAAQEKFEAELNQCYEDIAKDCEDSGMEWVPGTTGCVGTSE